ncbi:ATPase [Methanosarcina barkeri CM1]|uniref:ATPase n=1 Tax=Methanosarcina barkeri CM1 TaxID=796385 RepID=A0A0G3CGJ8_METBA|nr:ATPase [Methanosarcina barkeri CM1]
MYPFIFVETKELLENEPNSFIDISALIYLLRVNKNDSHPAYMNLREMTEDTKIILEESLAEDAMVFFPYLFSSYESFYKNKEILKTFEKPVTIPLYIRQPIYTYNNSIDLSKIIEYANEHNIPIATFSCASECLKSELEKFNQSAELTLLDLTSIAYAIDNNKNLIYSVESFLNQFQNIKIISLTAQIDNLLKYFPLYLSGQEPLRNLFPDLEGISLAEEQTQDIKKLTTLSKPEIDEFIEKFNHNLIGHEYFKNRFEYHIKNFIPLNKVREQKVLSIFLFGPSGNGKTEVARLIANGLLQDSSLAKINFQNYGSQDALNSLIGSPAGYIGCEHGELSDKVKKSKVGIVLCDEFEKATRPVFLFFLELLEEGKFTDSMAREYDLDGYIIVFTSNLQNEVEYKKVIPPELQTRFDLVCEFEEPTYSEKIQFLDLLLEQAQSKFIDQFSQIEMTPSEKRQLYDFNYSNVKDLRDIKKIFYQRLMDFFASKGIVL